MKNDPFISVIMPAYNVEQYISDAIESILKQTYKNFELLVVDDASTDKTNSIIQSFRKKDNRIVVVRNKRNIGVTKSLNKALKLAHGKYIVRMDADDWSYPERLKLQIQLMEYHPNVVVSGSYIEVCDRYLKTKYIRKYHLTDASIRKHLFRYSPFAHPATIWQAGVLKKERYDERIGICQDYELYFRIGKIGKFMNLSKPLFKLRMHEQSVSSVRSKYQLHSTILIRFIAVLLYGYSMSKFDKIYTLLQEMIVGILPVKARFFLFNFLRRFNFY